MKRISQVLSLFLLLTAATAMAQGPTSFRNIATGGTIDDNLDRAYDPIELRFVEGIHFYTNLSNLTSSNEKLLNNVSDHEFLFGVSLPNPWVDNLWTAVGFQMENSENSNFVAIDPDWGFGTMPQENGFGQLNYNYFAILDTDFDGTYDQQQTIFQEVTDYTTNDSYS
ncbi:hypothetical protein H8D51_03210, partial [bacterium]|nr:hypothetical protein [bacterium]